MKDALTNFDVYVLSRELSDAKRVSKIVRIPAGYKLKWRPVLDLIYVGGTLLIPTAYVIEADRPDNLAVISRKLFSNARVEAVRQLNFDRILEVKTDRGSIIFELFSRGNVILTDSEGTIVYATLQREWSSRTIKRGHRYQTPPAPAIYPGIDFDAFRSALTGRDIVRSLVRAGIPPVYAEEVAYRAELEPTTKINQLDSAGMRRLYDALNAIFSDLQNPEPTVYYAEDGTIEDVTVFPVTRYASLSSKTFPTLSEALDQLTPQLVQTTTQQNTGSKKEKGDIVELWKRQLEEARVELAELEEMINAAYANSHLLLQAMNLAKSGQKPLESAGPFRLKSWGKRELVFEFTRQ